MEMSSRDTEHIFLLSYLPTVHAHYTAARKFPDDQASSQSCSTQHRAY